MADLHVIRYDGVDQLRRLAPVLDRLNRESTDWSPFHTADFLLAYAVNSEFFPGGIMPCTYIVYLGTGDADPIGVVVLRRERVKAVGPFSSVRIDFLATHDTDEWSVTARAGHDAAVTGAIIDHLLEEDDWSLLEFRGQHPGSLLRAGLHCRANLMLRARDISLIPYERVNLSFDGMGSYFSALSKRMRSNVSRQTRHLFSVGKVEIVLAEGPKACGALFEAFLDLENRSWKAGTEVGLQRHSARRDFYDAVASGRAGLSPSFVGISLDGLLVAGLLNASGGGHAWSLEMAFDERYAELGPGQLLLLVSAGEAIGRGDKTLRFFQHHDYFKKRWLSESVPAANVQLIRTLSSVGVRASAGDVVRKLKVRRTDGGGQADDRGTPTFNELKRTNGIRPQPASDRLSCDRFAAALSCLDGDVRRIGPDQVEAFLPFPVLTGTATG